MAQKGSNRHCCTLSLSLALDGVSDQHHDPAALPQGEIPGTNFTGACVGSKAGLDGSGKLPDIEIWSPDLPARNQSLYRLRVAALFMQIHFVTLPEELIKEFCKETQNVFQ
jgi:hypothetical protein